MEQAKKYAKDCRLLRPFDLEKAKAGEKICWPTGDGDVVFVGCSSNGQVAWESEGVIGFIDPRENIRMAPLAWVEGRPVYKGDVLYSEKHGKGEIVEDKRFVGGAAIKFERTVMISLDAPYFATGLTWNQPNVKRGGLYAVLEGAPGNMVLFGPCRDVNDLDKKRPLGVLVVTTFLREWEE